MNTRDQQLQAFGKLLDIMDEIREKCPWDRKQTMQSLRHLTIEETYELGDAVLDNDLPEIKKELGDLLLHIVFYAKIAAETSSFDIADVINGINKKLTYRHPHVFGDIKAKTEEEVARNWEKLKLKEGKKSILEGVPKSLPALVKASRIQDKAACSGFDWEKPEQVFEKVQEEIIIELEPGKVIIVKLLSVSKPNVEGIRMVFFKINGENRFVEVHDKALDIKKVENVKADEANPDEIGSPLQGLLYKILVKKGQEIKENDPLFIIEAMKMETTVTAVRDCKVKSVTIKAGEMVMQDDLILEVD